MGEGADAVVLSIVTVNLDNARGVSRTIESLAPFRNRSDVECLFIDGNSIDESVDIARRFYPPANLVSETDSGIYNAMNKGLRRARGKYVLWLNSGDQFTGDRDEILEELRQASQAIVAYGMHFYSEAEQSFVSEWIPSIEDLPFGTFPHPGAFFDRRTTLRMAGYDETYRLVADRDLIVRMFLAGLPMKTHRRCIARFYTGGASSSPRSYVELLRSRRTLGLIGIPAYCYRSTIFAARQVVEGVRRRRSRLARTVRQWFSR